MDAQATDTQSINGKLRNIARHYHQGVLTDDDLHFYVMELLVPVGHDLSSVDACVSLIESGDI